MTTDAVGGVWTYAVDLAEGLGRRGFDVVLAVVGPGPSRVQAAEAAGATLIETGLTLDWLAESRDEIARTAQALAALARAHQADIVHLHAPSLAIEAHFDAPVIATCHSCVATWWTSVKGGPLPPDLAWRAEVQAEGMARCGGLIAPSAAFAKATQEVYGQSPRVVLNGRRDPGEGGGEIGAFIFTAGRLWDEGKNVAALNSAASIADLEIFAAGALAGPEGQQAPADRLERLGELSTAEVRSQLARRPIFVSTALYEPFGLAVLEAAQAGCPLVLSNIPTFRELWSDAAVFVDPKDPAQIAGALARLKDDPERLNRLSRAARARASGYTVEAMTEATLGVYDGVLAAAAEMAA